ncbi:MAG: hypothetical protein KKE11_01910 [Gammaproteobacteria bacterium]|nr:hypothetical protein [Gammaproteobacteria bacterium]
MLRIINNMIKTVYKAIMLILSWVSVFCFQNNCYAKTYIEEVEIPCAPSYYEAVSYISPPIFEFCKTLTTKGIKKPGHERFIIENEYQLLYVVAQCITLYEGREFISKEFDIFNESELKLSCNKGEGIRIVFKSPNSKNPDDYRYFGEILNYKEDGDDGERGGDGEEGEEGEKGEEEIFVGPPLFEYTDEGWSKKAGKPSPLSHVVRSIFRRNPPCYFGAGPGSKF